MGAGKVLILPRYSSDFLQFLACWEQTGNDAMEIQGIQLSFAKTGEGLFMGTLFFESHSTVRVLFIKTCYNKVVSPSDKLLEKPF